MSIAAPSMRKLFALVLAAGLLPVPAAALAEGGHHGHHSYRGHQGHQSHHGGLNLGIRVGHHGLYSGHHSRYGHGRGYTYYSQGYRSSYYRHGYRPRSYGYDSGYRAAPQAPYRASAGRKDTVGAGRLDLNQSNSTVRANRSNTPRAGRSYGYGPSTRPSNAHGIDQTRAWALLASDRPQDALQEFALQAAGEPTKGAPKIGYALASAMAGDLAKGAWAMRRALHIDADAMHYVEIDQQLRPRVEQLADEYQEAQDPPTANSDMTFMLAALRYLLGNVDAAHDAMRRLVHEGDSSTSARNLRQLIEKEKEIAATAS